MAEKLPGGDGCFVTAGQRGQPFFNGFVQTDPALISQSGNRQGGGQGLGQRCQVKDGVPGHGLAREQVGLAIGLEKKRLVALCHQQHRSGKYMVPDALSHQIIDGIAVHQRLPSRRAGPEKARVPEPVSSSTRRPNRQGHVDSLVAHFKSGQNGNVQSAHPLGDDTMDLFC